MITPCVDSFEGLTATRGVFADVWCEVSRAYTLQRQVSTARVGSAADSGAGVGKRNADAAFYESAYQPIAALVDRAWQRYRAR